MRKYPLVRYSIRGTLIGLAGGSVVLRNNANDDLTLSTDGPFVFGTAVSSGGQYAVALHTQPALPSQTCVVTDGAGTVAASDVTAVVVNCSLNSFSIGGTVTGLSGPGLILRNNGGSDLVVNANGSFTFSTGQYIHAYGAETAHDGDSIQPKRSRSTASVGVTASVLIDCGLSSCKETVAADSPARAALHRAHNRRHTVTS